MGRVFARCGAVRAAHRNSRSGKGKCILAILSPLVSKALLQ